MPEDYSIGYMWDPQNGVYVNIAQPYVGVPSEPVKGRKMTREEKRTQKMLDEATEAFMRQADGSSVSGYPREAPLVEEHPLGALLVGRGFGKMLQGVAPQVAGYMKETAPLWKQAAKRMAIDLPAFEAIDKLPQAWGDERLTQQGTNLIKQTTPIGKYAPWAVDVAGPFIAGMVPGMLGDMAVRGTAAGVNGIMNGMARRAAADRMGYLGPMAEAMEESPVRTSAQLGGESQNHIQTLLENGEFNPMDLEVGPAGSGGSAPTNLVRNADGSVMRTPDGYVIRRGRDFTDPNNPREFFYDNAGRRYDNITEASGNVVYPARIGNTNGMRGRSYARLANTLGVAPEDFHADMNLSGVNRRDLMDAATIADVRRSSLNEGLNVGDEGYLDVDALVNRLREQVRTSARNEMDDYVRSLQNMSYEELAASRTPDAWLDANYGLPEADHVDYHGPAYRARYDMMRDFERRGNSARTGLDSLRRAVSNMDEQEAEHLITILTGRNRGQNLQIDYGFNVDDLNVGRSSSTPELNVDDELQNILNRAIVRRDALVDARMNAAAASSQTSASGVVAGDPVSIAADAIRNNEDPSSIITNAYNAGADLNDIYKAIERAGIDPSDTSNPYVRAIVDRQKTYKRGQNMQKLVMDYGERFNLDGHGDNSSNYLDSYVRDYTEKAARRDIIDNFLNPNGHNGIIALKDIRTHYDTFKQQIDDALSTMPEGADPYEYLGNLPIIKNTAYKIANHQRWSRGVTKHTDREGAALSKYLTDKASAALSDNVAEAEFYNNNPNVRAYRVRRIDPMDGELFHALAEKEILEEMAAKKGLQHFNTDVLLDPFSQDYLALSKELRGIDDGAKILPGDVLHQSWFQGRSAIDAQTEINQMISGTQNPTRQQKQLFKKLENLANSQISLAHSAAGKQSEWLYRDIPRGGGSGEANTSPDSYRVQIATARRNWGDEPGKIKLIDTGMTVGGNNFQSDRLRVVLENGKYVLKYGKPLVYRDEVVLDDGKKVWKELVDQEGLNNLVSRIRNGEDLFDIINSDANAKETVNQLIEALARQKSGTFTGTNLNLNQINTKYGQNLRLIPDQSFVKPSDVGDRSTYSPRLLDSLRGLLNGRDIAPSMQRPYYISVKQKYGGFIDRLQKHYGSSDKILEVLNKFAGGGPAMSYVPSENIRNTLKGLEGYRGSWYNDGNGIPTVGYGFTGKKVRELYPNGMTRAQADAYFDELVMKLAARMAELTPNIDRLTQNQKDALFSYFYNIGEGNYTKGSPKMQQALRDMDLDTVALNIDAGYNDKKNPGLKKRRDYERALFQSDIQRPVQPMLPVMKNMNQGYIYNPPVEKQKPMAIIPYKTGAWSVANPFIYAPEHEYFLDNGFFGDYRSGGKIHIKPENRGKFTALKKRTGHSASWFKAHGTPAQKKMATFALNARKWKHGDGGVIERYGADRVLAAIQKLKG